VLYPVGVASELTIVWLAMPEIKDSGMLQYSMPNFINFGFDYYSICILISLVSDAAGYHLRSSS
jgi:very-long-chain (3R)-3-hydroxyacyl-CoA dehydratase